jgi:hypothetical protein
VPKKFYLFASLRERSRRSLFQSVHRGRMWKAVSDGYNW